MDDRLPLWKPRDADVKEAAEEKSKEKRCDEKHAELVHSMSIRFQSQAYCAG